MVQLLGSAFFHDGDTRTLDQKKADKIAQVEALRWQYSQGFTFNGIPNVASDDQATNRIATTLKLLEQPEIPAGTQVAWAITPTVTQMLDHEGVRLLGLAAGMHVQQCWGLRGQLVAAIMGAADEATLDAIDVFSPWAAVQ